MLSCPVHQEKEIEFDDSRGVRRRQSASYKEQQLQYYSGSKGSDYMPVSAVAYLYSMYNLETHVVSSHRIICHEIKNIRAS